MADKEVIYAPIHDRDLAISDLNDVIKTLRNVPPEPNPVRSEVFVRTMIGILQGGGYPRCMETE